MLVKFIFMHRGCHVKYTGREGTAGPVPQWEGSNFDEALV